MQPRDFGFDRESAILRDQARQFFSERLPARILHQLVAGGSDPPATDECRWDESLWQQIVELGWTAVGIPESKGGVGMPLVAAVALAEEAGRAAFPSPLQATLLAAYVLQACNTSEADRALDRIANGRTATLAFADRTGSMDPADTDVTVGDGGRLSGTAYFVQDPRKVDDLLVSAGNAGRVGLYLVDRRAAGVEVVPDFINDLTRDQAHIRFDNAEAIEMAPLGRGDAAIMEALPAMLCIVSADMVGAGEWLLQTTAEYVSTRHQFDRPLGYFQAIKHPLVNLMIEIDNARSLTYNAACAVDVGASNALDCARMAKAQASDMAVFSASRAVQFHGGIGFTWECAVQIFFKRQMHSHVLMGDGPYHRSKLADRLIGPPASMR